MNENENQNEFNNNPQDNNDSNLENHESNNTQNANFVSNENLEPEQNQSGAEPCDSQQHISTDNKADSPFDHLFDDPDLQKSK